MATRTSGKAGAASTTRTSPRSRGVEFPRHLVTAVLVAHDGATWLPEVLAALQWQRRPPQRVVAVDTGSRDDSRHILERELGASSVLDAPPTLGFGAAVGLALEAYAGAPEAPMPGRAGDAETVEWIWLLHDDCAPAPDALRHLLALGDASPSVGVIGPKVLGWDDPRVLIEIGFTVDTSGRRETGLERGELDQGQHDNVHDVLAVGSAGVLVRREVWDALGGFDADLPIYRDDLDFCWRAHLAGHRVCVAPQATIRHASAASNHRRHVHAAADRPRRVDRAHALYTLLVDLSAPGLFLTVPRLVIGTLLRALGFALTKRVGAAVDDLAALFAVMRRPGHLVAARRRRSATRQLPHRAARPLLAKRSVRLRHNLDVAASWLADRARGDDEAPPVRSVLESGPADDEFDEGGSHIFRRLLLRPGVALVLGLALVSLVAERHLLGSGELFGGRLLPTNAGAHDLWSEFVSAWHPVVTGSSSNAPPYLAILAMLATICLGKAWLAVDILLLGCVPLAGWTAYVAAGRISRNRVLRLWAAATYALLPVATGVVASGRLGDAVAFVCLPPLLLAGARLVRRDPGYDGWRHVGGAALLFAAVTAFAPLLYLVALPALFIATIAVRLAAPPTTQGAAVRRTLAVVVVAAAPLVLLWPWSGTVLSHPSLLLTVPGPATAGLTANELPPWHLLVAAPGGPGGPPVWLTIPLLLAGLAGLTRLAKRLIARCAWALAVLALGVGIVIAHVTVAATFAGPAGRVAGWPGIPAAVIGAALIAAALVGADGARERLARRSFSWRQPLAGAVAVAAAAIPLMTGLAWVVRGADDPVQRTGATVLPAFAAAEASLGERPRILTLRAAPGGGLAYMLLRGEGPRLGDADVMLRDADVAQLSAAVSDLAAARGDSPVAALATYGIRYVVLPSPVDPRLATVLDRTPGLTHSSSGDIWKVGTPTGRLVVLARGPAARALSATAPPTDAAAIDPPPTVLPAQAVNARATIPAGDPDRIVVLADSADDGWRADLNGRPLEPVVAWGWAQAFRLPTTGGSLHIWHSPGHRTGQLTLEAIVVALAVLLAIPTPGGGRRTDEPVVRPG